MAPILASQERGCPNESERIATIQVRNVPEEVRRTYKARAAVAGMSLQEYLLAELIESARSRSPGQIVAEVAAEITA